jgi:O-antigen/teichoic acid export membrane protein
MVSLLAVPAVSGLAAVSPLVVRVLLGPKWQDTSAVLSILAFYGLSRVLGSNAYTACVALGRLKDWFRITILHVLLLVPLLLVLTRSHGLIGAAIAYVVASMAVLPANIGITIHMLRIPIADMRGVLWRPVMASVAMYVCVRSAMGMTGGGEETASRAMVTLVLLVLLGLVTYAAAVWVMWRMSGRPEGAEVAAVRKALAESERLIPYRRSA